MVLRLPSTEERRVDRDFERDLDLNDFDRFLVDREADCLFLTDFDRDFRFGVAVIGPFLADMKVYAENPS